MHEEISAMKVTVGKSVLILSAACWLKFGYVTLDIHIGMA
jgi:hypothetical protein